MGGESKKAENEIGDFVIADAVDHEMKVVSLIDTRRRDPCYVTSTEDSYRASVDSKDAAPTKLP